MEPEIIHIPELAQMLGRSESSIRSARQAGATWLPPFFKQGSRICWRVCDAEMEKERADLLSIQIERMRHLKRAPGKAPEPTGTSPSV